MLVSEKVAGVAIPGALAGHGVRSACPPLAVNTADVATPAALVRAVLTPPANVPLEPLPGAANVTSTPLDGVPQLTVTVTTKGAPKAEMS